MEDENKTKLMAFKFPKWFREGLEKGAKDLGKTTVEAIVRPTARNLKIKIPKGYKFRGRNKEK